ncbi:hypothetical protein CONCODRAFT_12874 [Conidiobolus coronatus NRRL 28638]|uniref:F-box domain-containing protein n=1 Tax=Conidiobolus coronatus (strain ATCC 28846 / CBS 209.66 / NRRL 28638) TaxID=796925 RepID=A0A137NS11_CONC2|nr:hypothetical protein CONCODRAFT_12874 [Conidiobolus coronatus NRRL 28638]|eukprot:KXN65514.1 hypothetical protein CONCODRAFT_12874 [Conidiobolus coronatus NRRL 28638]
MTSYLVPQRSIPSLKDFGFISDYNYYSGVNQFIELNLQLESLIITSHSFNYTTLNLIKLMTNLKSLEFRGPINFNFETEIPILESIKNLSFNIVKPSNFQMIKELGFYCPNLTKMHFKMHTRKNFQNLIDKKVIELFNHFLHLKIFHFIIKGNISEKINFSEFNWLEVLIVESGQLTMINIDFESCTSLRKVILKSFCDINTIEFKNKFNSIEGWKFKFASNIIKGYKLLQ